MLSEICASRHLDSDYLDSPADAVEVIDCLEEEMKLVVLCWRSFRALQELNRVVFDS